MDLSREVATKQNFGCWDQVQQTLTNSGLEACARFSISIEFSKKGIGFFESTVCNFRKHENSGCRLF